jgi:hypothetical protein
MPIADAMTRWVTATIVEAMTQIPEVNVGDISQGEDHTTQTIRLEVSGSDNGLWVRGFRTDPKPIPNDDNVDVEMIEVTTGYSDGDMPNDPVLCVIHAQVKATLMKQGHSVVNSLEPYF